MGELTHLFCGRVSGEDEKDGDREAGTDTKQGHSIGGGCGNH